MKTKILKFIAIIVNLSLLITSMFFVNPNVIAEEIDYNQALTDLTSVFDFETLYNKLMSGSTIEELLIEMEEKNNTEYRVLIELKEKSLLSKYISEGTNLSYLEYTNTISAIEQTNIIAKEHEKVKKIITTEIEDIKFIDTYFDVFNGFSAVVKYKDILLLEELVDVDNVIISEKYDLPKIEEDSDVEEQLYNDSADMMNVEKVWEEYGYEGQGMVVAVLDTGLDYTHSAFTKDPLMPLLDYETVNSIANSTMAYQSYYSAQLAETSDISTIVNLTGKDLYKSSKVPFAYDYADGDTEVIPSEYAVEYLGNSHGTHVAGIVAGNDEILTGVAPQAQLAIMKVFSDEASGAYSDVLLSALSDCLLLGVDCINMSLGTPGGFSREKDSEYINEIYDQIRTAGINLYCSAGNSYSSTFMAPGGDYPLATNPDFGIISSSSSYYAATSVASIESIKNTSLPYFIVNEGTEKETNILYVNGTVYVGEVTEMRDFLQEMVSAGHLTLTERKTFEYVTIPGLGEKTDFEGLDLTGKIALIKRGTISFQEKANNAKEAGAIAVLIYDNIPEYGLSIAVEELTIPMVSVTLDAGSLMAEESTGTITMGVDLDYGGGTMSTFSSWGCLPSLELKPEITAPGGNVFSSMPFGEYSTMSGTSMASPNMAAAGALVKQYVEDMYSLSSEYDVEVLVNRLLMSTATTVYDLYGNPYSPRKQGAGLADVYNAIKTDAYIYVYGQDKPKLELGDDKKETGVYELSFRVVNFGTEKLSYKINTLAMTETLVSGMYLGQRADMLENYDVDIEVADAELNNDIVTVSPNKEARITVTITLNEETKKYLHDAFENGIYVEGFVQLEALDGEKIDLSIPWLSFFGDWTKAPIIDNNTADDLDAVMTETGVSGYLSFYGGAWESKFGTYVWDETQEIDFNFEEYISICPSAEEGVLGIYSIYTGLLRGCKKIVYTATDMATGEVIYQDEAVNARKSYYENGYGYVIPYYYDIMFPNYELPNNTWLKFEVVAYLDYDDPQYNTQNIFTFNVFVDNQSAEVVAQEEYGVYHQDGRTYVDVPVIDNHIILDYSLWTYSGDEYNPRGTEYLTMDPIVVRDYNLGEINTLTIDLTDFKDKLQRDENGNYNLVISLEDYALNASAYNIKIPYEAINSLEINHTELDLNINDTELLEVTFNPTTSWNQNLKWTSSNEEVVKVIDGRILAVGEGKAVVTALALDTADYDIPLQVTCKVNVSSEIGEGTRAEELEFEKDYYEVLVGDSLDLGLNIIPWYSNDEVIWTSSNEEALKVENGKVTGISTQGENYLDVTVKAYINDELFIETEVTVLNEFTYLIDESGGVFDGKKFVIYYNGKGGDIIIPEGVYGILDYTFVGNTNITSVTFPSSLKFIGEHGFYSSQIKKADFSLCSDVTFMRGAFACCYSLEEVILPETVYADLSLFHTCTSLTDVTMPTYWHQRLFEYDELNNLVGYDKYVDYPNTLSDTAFTNCEKLSTILIPETVNTIEFYAFYNCTSLKQIELGQNIKELGVYAFNKSGLEILDLTNTSLTSISMFAFAECESLEEVKLPEGIITIDAGAFFYCKNLTTINFPSTLIDYTDEEGNYINGIGAQSFYDTALTTVDLSNTNIEIIGSSAFIYCTEIVSVVFPNTLKEISDYAFYNHAPSVDDPSTNSKLSNVYLGTSLTIISDYAFGNNINLKNIVFPETLEEIGAYTFANSGLLKVTISSKVKTIGSYAFSSMPYITSMVFNEDSALEVIPEGFLYNSTEVTEFVWPDSLLEVGSYAFEQTKIVSMVVPETVTTINVYAFSYMAALKDIVFESINLEILGKFAFSRTTTLESITFKGTVEVIDNYAFIYTNIKTITLPNGLVSIGNDGTFFDCQELETIIFQKDTILVDDGKYAFSAFLFLDSNSIKEFIVDPDNEYYQSIDGFLYDKTSNGLSKTLLMAPKKFEGSYKIEDGVESVAPYAFMNTKGLTEIDLNDVKYIYARAFHGCSNITSVDLTNVSNIGLGAFSECLKLKDIILPNEIDEIGSSAFSLTAVEEITIPGSYKEVVEQMFYHCQKLRKVVLEEGITKIGDKAFEIISTYEADEWGLRHDVIYEESSLVEVIIPESVTSIGNRAFAGAANLASIDIPSSVQILGDGVFDGCSSLEAVDLSNVVYIGVEAFRGCTNLYDVVISKYLTYIYEAAFKDCTSLIEFKLPERLIYLGQYAFEGCSYLETITVPLGMGPIMLISSTFNGCIRLKEINVEDGNRSYSSDNGVLYTKDYVELVVYPIGKQDNSYELHENTLSVYHEAFINNEYIQEVVLNKNINCIGDKAFYNCKNLTRVVSLTAVAPQLRYFYEEGPINGFELYQVLRENNFKYQVLELKYNGITSDMELVIPSNAVGYDSNAWKLFFPTITYAAEAMGKETIDLFNSIEELYITSVKQKEYVEELNSLYNNLSDNQKVYITNFEKLANAYLKIQELEEKILSDNKVKEVIDAINGLDLININQEEVISVKDLFDKLQESEKEQIYNYINLELCLETLLKLEKEQHLQISNEFIDLVNSVISSTFEEKENKIEAAKNYYNSLTNKDFVEVIYSILEKEIAKYNFEKNARVVVDMINSIGEVTQSSKELLTSITSAYNNLSDEEKAYVTNISTLEVAKLRYEIISQENIEESNIVVPTIVICSIVVLIGISVAVIIIKRKK